MRLGLRLVESGAHFCRPTDTVFDSQQRTTVILALIPSPAVGEGT